MYTAWNYRKEAIASVLDGDDRESAAGVAGVELELTEKALRKNPKSYSTWQHRKVPGLPLCGYLAIRHVLAATAGLALHSGLSSGSWHRLRMNWA